MLESIWIIQLRLITFLSRFSVDKTFSFHVVQKGGKVLQGEINLILFIDFRKAFHYLNVYMDVYTIL